MNTFSEALKSVQTNGLRTTAKKVVVKTAGRWFEEMNHQATFNEQKNLITALDITPEQYAENHRIVTDAEFLHSNVKTINWFIPQFEHVLYGGVYTLFRFADYFQRNKQIQNRIIIYDNPFIDIVALKKNVCTQFPELESAEFIAHTGDLNALPECDATVATFWTSAFVSLKFNKTKKKFYFIQDYEPLFYPAGSYYALVEATYRFGFRGIVNTPGLEAYVKQQHGMDTASFYPCINQELYFISEEQIQEKLKKETIRIVLYGRPRHGRNAFELALVALQQLKAKYGERVEIISVGDTWEESEYGVEGVIKNLGRLNNLSDVADLYRTADIGLVFMFTKHPSYQPFEYMASGCAVVTNHNSANTWLLKHEENAMVSEPIPSAIVQTISRLIKDPALRERVIRNGLKEIQQQTWDTQCERMFHFINN